MRFRASPVDPHRRDAGDTGAEIVTTPTKAAIQRKKMTPSYIG
jgi:hypothetical protein